MPSSQGHINQALSAVPQRNLNLTCLITSLNSGEVPRIRIIIILICILPQIIVVVDDLELILMPSVLKLMVNKVLPGTLLHLPSILNTHYVITILAMSRRISMLIVPNHHSWVLWQVDGHHVAWAPAHL